MPEWQERTIDPAAVGASRWVPCATPASCSPNNTCVAGSQGWMCVECVQAPDIYVRSQTGQCTPCSKARSVNLVVGMVVGLVGAVALGATGLWWRRNVTWRVLELAGYGWVLTLLCVRRGAGGAAAAEPEKPGADAPLEAADGGGPALEAPPPPPLQPPPLCCAPCPAWP